MSARWVDEVLAASAEHHARRVERMLLAGVPADRVDETLARVQALVMASPLRFDDVLDDVLAAMRPAVEPSMLDAFGLRLIWDEADDPSEELVARFRRIYGERSTAVWSTAQAIARLNRCRRRAADALRKLAERESI